MPTHVRRDILTGRLAAVVDWEGKPAPAITRSLPESRATCPFCLMTRGQPHAGDHVHDDDTARVVLQSNDSAICVENRWAVFTGAAGHGQDSTQAPLEHQDTWPLLGVNEIVLMRDHATTLEELTSKKRNDFFDLLLDRRKQHANAAGVEAFVNVGVQAGSSIAHLHGQIVAGNTPAEPCGTHNETCPVCIDVHRARDARLVIEERENWTAYVPWAPSNNAELRVAAQPCARAGPGTPQALAEATGALLEAAQVLGFSWPYNVVPHPEGHAHAHVLVRLDPGVVYQRGFNLVPVPLSLTELAESLRKAMSEHT